MTEHPPDNRLSELAREHELGSFVRRHPAFRDAVTASVWYTLGGLAFAAYAVSGTVLGFDVDRLVLAGVFAIGLLLLGYGAVSFVRLRAQQVQLHERGFVTQKLGQTQVVPYRDLLGVRVNVTRSRPFGNSLTTQHGSILAILRDRRVELGPDVENVDTFTDELVKRAGDDVVKNVLGELRAGRDVDCGAVTLTPQGVSVGGRTLNYSGQLRAWVDSSHVSVKGKKGQEVKFRKAKLINAPYLESVIRAMDPSCRERVGS